MSEDVFSCNKCLFLRQGFEGESLALQELTELENQNSFRVCNPFSGCNPSCALGADQPLLVGVHRCVCVVCLYLLWVLLVPKGVILHFAGLICYSIK